MRFSNTNAILIVTCLAGMTIAFSVGTAIASPIAQSTEPQQNVSTPIVLTYDVKVTRKTDDKGLSLDTAEISEHQMVVSLMDQRLGVTGSVASILGSGFSDDSPATSVRLYDFEQKFVYILNKADNTFSQIDLHAIVMFRANEFIHRRALLAAHDAAGIPLRSFGGPMNEFALSTMFGLPKTKARLINRNTSGKWKLAEYHGKPVVAYMFSDDQIPQTLRQSFLRFLAYELPLCPAARELLVVGDKIPERISIPYINDQGETELLLRLKSIEQKIIPDHQAVSETFRKEHFTTQRFNSEIAKVMEGSPPSKTQARKDAEAALDEASKRDLPLDAALAYYEYFEQTGDGVFRNKMIQELENSGKLDKLSETFLGEQELASEELIALRKAAEEKGHQRLYVLDYLIGDRLLAEGDPIAAEPYLRASLKGNRWLVGAYVDLARIEIDDFVIPEAWELFAAARRICPEHPWLQPITDVEKLLEQDFPDFF